MHIVCTFNNTQFTVWITVYDFAQRGHLAYGWLYPLYSPPDLYYNNIPYCYQLWQGDPVMGVLTMHVRAEVKDPNTGYTIADTRIEVDPSLNPKDKIVTLQGDQYHGFWWSHGTPEGIVPDVIQLG